MATIVADTTFTDNPDTPAHVFAARAFQYRLWGTPKPQDTVAQSRARPDSYYAGDDALPMGVPSSPSKKNGILMTPGTANLRRSKTVSFGAQKGAEKPQQRMQGATRNKTAPVVPGKFPTPSRADLTAMDVPIAEPQSQTKFTEKLRHARSASENNAVRVDIKRKLEPEQEKITETLSNPLIDWKERYDQYSARTEREMKRLIAKQQAAKQYARKKDTAATQLAEHLHEERMKITSLEGQITSLTDEVVRMQKDLMVATARAKADPSRSIDDYDDAVSKPAPLRPKRSMDALQASSAPAIPKRSPSRRPPPPTTDKDIWAASVIVLPEEARKTQFEDDFISSHLRRTRQTPTRSSARPSGPIPKPDSNPLKPRDINVDSTTPKQTPPSSRRRSTIYSPTSNRRRSLHHTPSRPSARRSRHGLADTARASQLNKALPRPPPAQEDLDASLALPLPSPEADFSALPQRDTFSIKPIEGVKPVQPLRSTRPLAAGSSPFIMDADAKYDRMAMPYSVPSPSPKARASLESRSDRRTSAATRALSTTSRPQVMTRGADSINAAGAERSTVRNDARIIPELDRRDSANDTSPYPAYKDERRPLGTSRAGKDNAEGRESARQGWKDELGLQATPRRALDAERRAKAAARIAARRREREMKASVAA
ncbi:Hypothetical protein D9617_33g038390 [Elsinoe fawcettii]|nr:Hypothetical protein D9617_33g038390 [Elsinoe fawcettii]